MLPISSFSTLGPDFRMGRKPEGHYPTTTTFAAAMAARRAGRRGCDTQGRDLVMGVCLAGSVTVLHLPAYWLGAGTVEAAGTRAAWGNGLFTCLPTWLSYLSLRSSTLALPSLSCVHPVLSWTSSASPREDGLLLDGPPWYFVPGALCGP